MNLYCAFLGCFVCVKWSVSGYVWSHNEDKIWGPSNGNDFNTVLTIYCIPKPSRKNLSEFYVLNETKLFLFDKLFSSWWQMQKWLIFVRRTTHTRVHKLTVFNPHWLFLILLYCSQIKANINRIYFQPLTE